MARRKKSYEDLMRDREKDAPPLAGRPLLELFESRLSAIEHIRTVENLSERAITGGNKHTLRRTLLGLPPRRLLKLSEVVRISNETQIPLAEIILMLGYPLEVSVPLWGVAGPSGEITQAIGEKVPAAPVGGVGVRAVRFEGPGPWDQAVYYFRVAEDRAVNDTERPCVLWPAGATHALLGTLEEDSQGRFYVTPVGQTNKLRIGAIERSSPVLWVKLTK